MRTTIDKAGRLVIPKSMRLSLGLTEAEVEITVEGTGLRIEPVVGVELATEAGRTVIPPSGATLTDQAVQALRHADQR